MTQTHTHCKQVEPQTYPARNRKRFLLVFAVALVVSIVAKFTFEARPYFAWDGTFWFYPVLGLLAPVGFVLVSRVLGIVLKRRETYWEEKP